MHSITWRLVRWYASILSLILIICGSAALLSMRYLLFNEATREVKEAITTVRRITTPEEKNLDIPELTASIENDLIEVRITSPNGQALTSSSTMTGKVLISSYVGPPIIRNFQRQEFLLAGIKLAGGTLIQIARPLNQEAGFLNTLAGVFGLLILVGLLLAVIGGWLITRAALNPIQNLTRTARSITATDLARRITLTGTHDELYQLAETFNQMLDNGWSKGFKANRNF